jgi:hypothetical protein
MTVWRSEQAVIDVAVAYAMSRMVLMFRMHRSCKW